MKEVVVDITGSGEVKIDAIGFKGRDCEEVTKAITRALGGDVKSDKKKPEYNERRSEQRKVRT